MSYHVGKCLTMQGVVPETRLSTQQFEQIGDCVLRQVNRTMAYSITCYVDWLVYTCVRYLENGGLDDLSHIKRGIVWPLDVPGELQDKVVDDIYYIVRPLIINADKYKAANIQPIFDVAKVVELMVEKCKDANWSVINRAMKVMEESLKDKPYTDKLINVLKGK